MECSVGVEYFGRSRFRGDDGAHSMDVFTRKLERVEVGNANFGCRPDRQQGLTYTQRLDIFSNKFVLFCVVHMVCG